MSHKSFREQHKHLVKGTTDAPKGSRFRKASVYLGVITVSAMMGALMIGAAYRTPPPTTTAEAPTQTARITHEALSEAEACSSIEQLEAERTVDNYIGCVTIPHGATVYDARLENGYWFFKVEVRDDQDVPAELVASTEKLTLWNDAMRTAAKAAPARRVVANVNEEVTGPDARAASRACIRSIEGKARYDHRWTDGFFSSKFASTRYLNGSGKQLRLMGNQIELQNGFGAWVRHTYICRYDSAAGKVFDVRMAVGR